MERATGRAGDELVNKRFLRGSRSDEPAAGFSASLTQPVTRTGREAQWYGSTKTGFKTFRIASEMIEFNWCLMPDWCQLL
jgi:hypothetical protein